MNSIFQTLQILNVQEEKFVNLQLKGRVLAYNVSNSCFEAASASSPGYLMGRTRNFDHRPNKCQGFALVLSLYQNLIYQPQRRRGRLAASFTISQFTERKKRKNSRCACGTRRPKTKMLLNPLLGKIQRGVDRIKRIRIL